MKTGAARYKFAFSTRDIKGLEQTLTKLFISCFYIHLRGVNHTVGDDSATLPNFFYKCRSRRAPLAQKQLIKKLKKAGTTHRPFIRIFNNLCGKAYLITSRPERSSTPLKMLIM